MLRVILFLKIVKLPTYTHPIKKEVALDITKYTAYFHDGNLIDIQHQGENVYLFLESAQLPISGV